MIGRGARALSDRARARLVGRGPTRRRAPLYVLLTIDTEISLGGAIQDPRLRPIGVGPRIWGDTPRGRAGIEELMDIFDAHGQRGVFFFEVEARHLVPEADLAAAAARIHDRGHDVELHLHPEFSPPDPADTAPDEASPPRPQLGRQAPTPPPDSPWGADHSAPNPPAAQPGLHKSTAASSCPTGADHASTGHAGPNPPTLQPGLQTPPPDRADEASRAEATLARLRELGPASPRICDLPPAAQVARIRAGAERIQSWTGRRPVAFRAGSYGADATTAEAVREAGLRFESSYNRWAVQDGGCGFPAEPALNDLTPWGQGLWELPLTCYQAPGPRGGLRQLDLAGMSATEVIAVLEAQYAAGATAACAITHSFRLLRTTNVQYTDARPDPVNLHRMRAVCRYLAAHPERFQVVGFEGLPTPAHTDPAATGPDHSQGMHELPQVSRPLAWTRLLQQAIKDRGVL